jgi:hypothetical protein
VDFGLEQREPIPLALDGVQALLELEQVRAPVALPLRAWWRS